MTNKQKQAYSEPEALKDILYRVLHNKRFTLECGHHITFFNSTLGNDLILQNGFNKGFKIICADCGQ